MSEVTEIVSDADLARIRSHPEGRRYLDILRQWLEAGEHRKALEERQRARVEERADVTARQAALASEAARLDQTLAEIPAEIRSAAERVADLRRQLDAETAGA